MKRILLASITLLLSAMPALAQSTPTVYSTAQRFESGLMIWRSDTAFIWVLGNNGRVLNFPASSYSGLPDNPIFGSPPGRLRPILGFGKVWGNNRSVRDLLGWPTLPEIGFNMPIVYTNRTYYLTQLDGTIIQINPDNTWTRATSSPPPTARILSFTASADAVVPGQPLTLAWSVEGTQVVLIEVYNQADNSLVTFLPDLPLASSTTITTPAGLTNNLRIVIWGANRYQPRGTLVNMYERLVQSQLIIGVNVAESSVTTQAAYQPYERGFMLWRADTGGVMMFSTTAPHVAFFRQSDYEGLPDNPITSVPTGFIRPINGFGRVWGNFQHARDSLGYATGAEQGYTLTARILGGGAISYTLPDGRVATVDGLGAWHF